MQSIRRTVLALTTMLLAIVVGSGTAFAGPKPLPPSDPEFITPEKASTSGGGFLDSWPQVTISILVVAAVLAIAVVAMPRLRHRTPTTA
jgi:hypothetical protein